MTAAIIHLSFPFSTSAATRSVVGVQDGAVRGRRSGPAEVRGRGGRRAAAIMAYESGVGRPRLGPATPRLSAGRQRRQPRPAAPSPCMHASAGNKKEARGRSRWPAAPCLRRSPPSCSGRAPPGETATRGSNASRQSEAFWQHRNGIHKVWTPKAVWPRLLGLTSDQSPLYPALPSNMLGSFLIGWFGIIFKADIRQISDHLIVEITTGYMGSLTTFSGWNQKNGCLILQRPLGMFIVNESIAVGAETGERLQSLIMKYIREKSSIGHKYEWEHWRVHTRTKQSVLLSAVMMLMSLLWVLSIVLAAVKVRNHADGAVLWMGC